MNNRIILTTVLLLCSAFSVLTQAQSLHDPSVFHYFITPEPHGKINEAVLGDLQEFASKSLNIEIFIHAKKLCWYFEGNKIPCMGYADFAQVLVHTICKDPKSDWNAILTGSAAAHYGRAGEMILAYFREKQQYGANPSPALLVQHQHLFDMMQSRTKNSKLHHERIRRSRGELDLVTLQNFPRAIRFRLAHTPADLKKRCLGSWGKENISGKDPSHQKVFRHFRKIYMDKLRAACRINGIDL